MPLFEPKADKSVYAKRNLKRLIKAPDELGKIWNMNEQRTPGHRRRFRAW